MSSKRTSIALALIVLAACGGGGGGSSTPPAAPSAGWVVASHLNAGTESLDFFRADQPDVVVDTIPEGYLLNLPQTNSPFVNGTSLLFGVGPGRNNAQIGLVTGGTSRFFYGNAPGHTYFVYGLLGSRILYHDRTGAGTFVVKSRRLVDGGDEQTLIAGPCTVNGVQRFMVEPHGAGAAVQCDTGATYHIHYTDGISGAGSQQLPENNTFLLLAITPPDAAVTDRRVYFFDMATARVVQQTISAGAPSQLSSTATGTQSLFGTGDGRVVLVNSGTASNNYISSYDYVGNNFIPIVTPGNLLLTHDSTTGNVPDGSGYVTIASGSAFMAFAGLAANNFVPLGAGAGDYAALISNDRVIVHGGPNSHQFRIHDRFTGAQIGSPISATNNTDTYIGESEDWVALYNGVTTELWVYRTDALASHRLSTKVNGVNDVLMLEHRRVLWRENDGTTWIATMDYDIPVAGAGIAPRKIDSIIAYRILHAQTAADPDRIFYVARRTAAPEPDPNADYDVMSVLLASGTAGPVAGAGSKSEDGYFIP